MENTNTTGKFLLRLHKEKNKRKHKQYCQQKWGHIQQRFKKYSSEY